LRRNIGESFKLGVCHGLLLVGIPLSSFGLVVSDGWLSVDGSLLGFFQFRLGSSHIGLIVILILEEFEDVLYSNTVTHFLAMQSVH